MLACPTEAGLQQGTFNSVFTLMEEEISSAASPFEDSEKLPGLATNESWRCSLTVHHNHLFIQTPAATLLVYVWHFVQLDPGLSDLTLVTQTSP